MMEDNDSKASGQEGDHSAQEGAPSAQDANPTDQAGNPSVEEGTPSGKEGVPSEQAGNPAGQEANPTGQEVEKRINLKVQDVHGNKTQFKIKTATALKKLMATYCERNNLDFESTRFHFDGERVKGSDTAASLGMVEGDTIEAFLAMEGGSSSSG